MMIEKLEDVILTCDLPEGEVKRVGSLFSG